MKMYELKCNVCGEINPADKCPQVLSVPMCKSCWLKKHLKRQSNE